jgi:hypothetical protein
MPGAFRKTVEVELYEEDLAFPLDLGIARSAGLVGMDHQ